MSFYYEWRQQTTMVLAVPMTLPQTVITDILISHFFCDRNLERTFMDIITAKPWQLLDLLINIVI